MTVVPFAPFRFTPSDLKAFNVVAVPKLGSGLWAKTARITHKDCDEIYIWIKSNDKPIICFQRGPSGRYTLQVHDPNGWHVASEGDSAQICLWPYLPRNLIQKDAV